MSTYIERYLRRRARQQSYFQQVEVTRYRINERTGAIRESTRRVKRRKQHYTGGSGFLVVNDGLAAAAELEQLVSWWCEVTGHAAGAFSMYQRLRDAHGRIETTA
ncbi:hypothetical protein ACXR2T_12080 [Leucobacter sp. HY1910]